MTERVSSVESKLPSTVCCHHLLGWKAAPPQFGRQHLRVSELSAPERLRCEARPRINRVAALVVTRLQADHVDLWALALRR